MFSAKNIAEKKDGGVIFSRNSNFIDQVNVDLSSTDSFATATNDFFVNTTESNSIKTVFNVEANKGLSKYKVCKANVEKTVKVKRADRCNLKLSIECQNCNQVTKPPFGVDIDCYQTMQYIYRVTNIDIDTVPAIAITSLVTSNIARLRDGTKDAEKREYHEKWGYPTIGSEFSFVNEFVVDTCNTISVRTVLRVGAIGDDEFCGYYSIEE